MNFESVAVGKTIDFFLKEKKMLKGDLAKGIGVSAGLLSGYLKGRHSLSLGRFFLVCEVLEITPIVFINRYKKAKETIKIGVEV